MLGTRLVVRGRIRQDRRATNVEVRGHNNARRSDMSVKYFYFSINSAFNKPIIGDVGSRQLIKAVKCIRKKTYHRVEPHRQSSFDNSSKLKSVFDRIAHQVFSQKERLKDDPWQDDNR